MANSAPSSAHTVHMSASARQFLESRIEAAGQQDVMLPALQMSVKMSGHLITIRAWEGRLVFAAKNSAENEYTLSAQLVLDQMLGREAVVRLIKAMEDASICLSFECITSFNGDHGYPERSAVDVMICTAIHTVTELGPSDPWTYASVFAFCRSHGLPCGQCLYAFDEASAVSAFDAYRGMRHQFGPHATQLESMFDTFSAQHLCVALESFSHAYVSDVVEGFVVRSTMLSREDIQILLVSEKEGPVPMDLERLLHHNLRRAVNDVSGCLLKHEHALSLWERTCKEGGGFPVVPLQRVGKWVNLRQYLGGKNNLPMGYKVKPPKPRGEGSSSTSSMAMLKDLLDPSDTAASGVAAKDTRTQFVLSVLNTCIELGIKVNVSFYSETTEEESGKELLHLAILHVVYDTHHFKFHRHAESVERSIPLALYRGFVIRLMKTTTNAEGGKGTLTMAEVFANFYPKFDNARQQDSTRLISDFWENRQSGGIKKFKFAFYMYATMLCRALLEVGRVGSHPKAMGIQQWELKCKTMLSKWGMNLKDQVPYLLRLLSWHEYVKRNINKGPSMGPPMRSSTYLTHFCHFLSEEALWRQQVLQRKNRISVMSRTVYVVAPEHHFRYREPGTKNDVVDATVSSPSSKVAAYYADSLADKLGVEWVALAGRQGYAEKSTMKSQKQHDEKRKKKQQQNSHDEYIDKHFNDKVVVVGCIGVTKKCMSCLNTVNHLPTCSSEDGEENDNTKGSRKIPILPENAKVADETVAVVDFDAISALPQGKVKSELSRWVKMFQECTSEVWDMNEHPPGSVANSLLEMESRVVQPILIFPCGIPGSGKSAFGRVLSEYGVKMVCSDDKSAPKKDKRSYDAIIESRLKPFTVRRRSSRRASELAAAITGKGGGAAEQQQLPGIQHSEAECHNMDGATNTTITNGQPTLSAVYRDKNASSDQCVLLYCSA